MSTVLAAIQILPNLKDDHTGGTIDGLVEKIKNSGLEYKVGPFETVIEGDYNVIMTLFKELHEEAVKAGSDELFTTIKIHYKSNGISLDDKK